MCDIDGSVSFPLILNVYLYINAIKLKIKCTFWTSSIQQ